VEKILKRGRRGENWNFGGGTLGSTMIDNVSVRIGVVGGERGAERGR